jgi:GNAT superfamily N-acetyltransferase
MREQRAVSGATTGRVVWFQENPEGAKTRLLLKTFRDQNKRHRGEAVQLADCAVADTFPAFAEQLGTTDLPSFTRGSGLDSQTVLSPHYRRRGHGVALWRAAMAWGAQNGAKYKVLQAASGSVSELFYLSECLSTLGFMCSTTGE